MNNLLSLGIDKDIINKMIKQNDYETIENLDFNIDNFKKIYTYMFNLNINNLRELLIDYTIIFEKKYDDFLNAISEYDKNVLKQIIEEDPNYFIEIIYN